MGGVPGVLHVCTANRCRSAIAERIMRAALPAELPVTSAGTRARPGEPIWPEAGVVLERMGLSGLGFDSHPVEPALMNGADLVLAATRAHRDELLAAYPSALRRTFTWRELAWLVEGLDPGQPPGRTPAERLAALPAVAAGRRGLLRAPAPELLDVADPVGGPAGAVEEAARQIELALRPVIALLLMP
jgi:protein-tyrosine phosphatase